MKILRLLAAAGLAAPLAAAQTNPVLAVRADNTVVDRSCTIRIAKDAVIADADGNGVIQVKGAGLTVAFEPGSVLRGGPDGADGDTLTGVGIAIKDAANLTLRGAVVRGFKVGVLAQNADGMTIAGADLSGNYRQRLKSTPKGEDGGDWLWPHANDKQEWRTNYGAALCIETSKGVTVHDVRVRRGQNGIILDRVSDSRVYDNDCSFLSGWGIAMWRSSGNVLSRNAVDFCVRGHNEGVYNRGQDSAGFLVFEQCHRNLFIENSATHGGDGFFGFAGKEAIGEVDRPGAGPGPLPLAEIGCNENQLIDNDFSYAPAHGIEMTFSRGNRFIHNRVVENAICGVWGGYSNDTVIAENLFEGNGGMAYGLECGGVNIEHGSGNTIQANRFINNRCGVHVWWDNDEHLLKFPGVKATHRGVTGNVIAENRFEINEKNPFTGPRDKGPLVGVRLRDGGEGNVKETLYVGNILALSDPRAVEFDLKPGLEPRTEGKVEPIYHNPDIKPIGESNPVGKRAALRGRKNIIMGEWGPWDHETPMARVRSLDAGAHVYEVYGFGRDVPKVVCDGSAKVEGSADGVGPVVVTVTPRQSADVSAYTLSIEGRGMRWTRSGTFVKATWECVSFPWSKDPREDYAGWTAERLRVPRAVATVDALNFPFGGGGPRDMKQFAAEKEKAAGGDRFGIVAVSTMTLPRGSWKFWTMSDDGVRVKVTVNGVSTTLIDNWTWHGPTRDEAVFQQEAQGPVTVTVEYFEIDGHAVLQLGIEPVP